MSITLHQFIRQHPRIPGFAQQRSNHAKPCSPLTLTRYHDHDLTEANNSTINNRIIGVVHPNILLPQYKISEVQNLSTKRNRRISN
ncbi:hypothetical protein NQ318_009725 [Aromia moschata]|uniref:Uncharacterized protein n=1 Tax=Aromia moschata TaxID=1265417 RepID=A0AAV8Y1R4_9CUCU|nr:hypothetical protein NQ318_009725 [Aromia moschata]